MVYGKSALSKAGNLPNRDSIEYSKMPPMECPIASNFPSFVMLCFKMYSICPIKIKPKKSYKNKIYAAREGFF